MFKSTKSDTVPPMSQIPNMNIEPGQRCPTRRRTACVLWLSFSPLSLFHNPSTALVCPFAVKIEGEGRGRPVCLYALGENCTVLQQSQKLRSKM